MVSDVDLLRSAKLVLDHHGEDALVYAAKRADELLERGDPQGYEVWLAILGVIEAARAHLTKHDLNIAMPRKTRKGLPSMYLDEHMDPQGG